MHGFHNALGLALVLSVLSTGPAKLQPAIETSRDAIAADHRLGFEFYRQLAKTGETVVLSPYSISAAMTIAPAGARGDTKKEMTAALHSDLTAGNVADGQRRLAVALKRQAADGGATVKVANALHLMRLGHLVTPGLQAASRRAIRAQIFEGPDLATVNGSPV